MTIFVCIALIILYFILIFGFFINQPKIKNFYLTETDFSSGIEAYENNIKFKNLYDSFMSSLGNDSEFTKYQRKRTINILILTVSILICVLIFICTRYTSNRLSVASSIFLVAFVSASIYSFCNLQISNSKIKTKFSDIGFKNFYKEIFGEVEFCDIPVNAEVYKNETENLIQLNFINNENSVANSVKNIIELYANSGFSLNNFKNNLVIKNRYNIIIRNSIIDNKNKYSFSHKLDYKISRNNPRSQLKLYIEDYLAIIENNKFNNCYHSTQHSNFISNEVNSNKRENSFLDSLYKKYKMHFDLRSESGNVFLRININRQNDFRLFKISFYNENKNIEYCYLSYIILIRMKEMCDEIRNYI